MCISGIKTKSSNRLNPTREAIGEAPRFYKVKEMGLGGFPGGAVVENLPANSGDTGSSPGLGRSHIAAEQLCP